MVRVGHAPVRGKCFFETGADPSRRFRFPRYGVELVVKGAKVVAAGIQGEG